MNVALKPISPSAIPDALHKVERYRLLNEPTEAQSICEDILAIDPENQDALIMLILSITDQFEDAGSAREARAFLPRLRSPYHRAYYAGIVSERSAKLLLRGTVPGRHYAAYEALTEAMRFFDEAESLRPDGNDDAILRWNTCARILKKNPALQPRPEEKYHEVLGE